MPSWAASKRRRYRASEDVRASSARFRAGGVPDHGQAEGAPVPLEGAQPDFDREGRAVPPAVPGFEGHLPPGRQLLRHPREPLRGRARVDFRHGHADEFVPGVAQALAGAAVHVQDRAGGVVQEEAVARLLDEVAEPGLARPQGLLRPLPGADVLGHHQGPRRAARRVGDEARARLDPNAVPVLPPVLEVTDPFLLGEDLLQVVRQPGAERLGVAVVVGAARPSPRGSSRTAGSPPRSSTSRCRPGSSTTTASRTLARIRALLARRASARRLSSTSSRRAALDDASSAVRPATSRSSSLDVRIPAPPARPGRGRSPPPRRRWR